MRCSWSERLLDRYVECTLNPRTMHEVATHVASCANCAALLTELRVVDALLETTKSPELPINFTFAVMADVRIAVAPRVRRFAWWVVAVAYLALAWVVGLVIALDSDGATRARLAQAFVPLTTDWNALLSAFVGTSRALGGGNPLVTGVGFAILVSDILALTAILYFYRNLRPRLAAHLARVTETAR
jgi:hypothetical protein